MVTETPDQEQRKPQSLSNTEKMLARRKFPQNAIMGLVFSGKRDTSYFNTRRPGSYALLISGVIHDLIPSDVIKRMHRLFSQGSDETFKGL